MPILTRGGMHARFARGARDHAAVQALRAACFRGGVPDGDDFDARCRHVLIERGADTPLLGCFRLLSIPQGGIGVSYAAQFYDLTRLAQMPCAMLELGRFCIAPGQRDADILRLAWGALTRLVDDEGVGMLFGCSSFRGCDPASFGDAFALLSGRHLAPAALAPGVGAAETVPLGSVSGLPARGGKAVPPLLRTYLAMGGWVSDHAVVDRDLGTLHVFTGLEIAKVPPARARLLRAVAG